jgi:hypothetical protein
MLKYPTQLIPSIQHCFRFSYNFSATLPEHSSRNKDRVLVENSNEVTIPEVAYDPYDTIVSLKV